MSRDSEEASKQLSLVHKGVGYDEVFPSGYGPEEGLSWSLEREPSAYSPIDEEEDYDREEVEEREGDEDEYDEGEGEKEGEFEGEDDEDEGGSNMGASVGESLGCLGDGHNRPFILHAIWTINDFKPTMMTKIFNNLRDRYQIPDNIPIRLLGKYEKC